MSARPIDAVLARLRKVKPNGDRSWLACCPAHDDRNPSLSVSVGDDGRVLFNCFAGCTSDDVRAALGLEWRDLHAEPMEAARHGTRAPRAAQGTPQRDNVPTRSTGDPPPPKGQVFASLEDIVAAYRKLIGRGDPSASWTYRSREGEVLGLVLRWNASHGRKEIRPAWRFPDGWRMTAPATRPLYGLDRLGIEDRVFVVEGEKAADRLHALGFPTVTSLGGSKAADRADWSTLTASEVVIVPDADDAGIAYAKSVAEQIRGDDRIVGVLRLPGLKPQSGEDVVEWIDNVHEGDEAAAAREFEHLALEAVWSERRKQQVVTVADVLDDPAWSRPPEVLRTGVLWYDTVQPFGGIERGTLTVVAAPPRCYKTTLLLFLAWKLAASGRRVHYLAGEMSRPQLVRRIVAMSAQVAPAIVADPRTPAMIDRVGTAIQGIRRLGERLSIGRAPITLGGIATAAETADVVFVDYLQLIQPDAEHVGSGRVDELEAAMRSVLAATQQGATVIAAAALNRVGRDTVSLGSIRGSSAIEYGATTVYAATESLVGIDPDGDPDGNRDDPGEPIPIEYRCVKQREGEPLPLRFDLALQLGPLPVDPRE